MIISLSMIEVVRELRITGRAAERSQARKRWPLIRQLALRRVTHARKMSMRSFTT